MKRPALLAASLSALAAALASAQASACSPPPDGWQVLGLQPADGATDVPVDMPLVVRTQTFSGTLPTADDLAAAPPVLRDAAGEAVPGTAALAGFDGLFYFVPDAPLAPNAAYTWSITHVEPWSEQPTETTARFRTGAARFEPAVQDAIGALGQTPVVMPLTDGCDPNGGFDSCGGCDPLVVGQRGAIDVVLSRRRPLRRACRPWRDPRRGPRAGCAQRALHAVDGGGEPRHSRRGPHRAAHMDKRARLRRARGHRCARARVGGRCLVRRRDRVAAARPQPARRRADRAD